jgi:NAD(P)-dependent dehydrogenase (short-subunit alcohol dehydrogenase family)
MKRYVLLTGASGGIGTAAAAALVRRGYTVFAGDIRAQSAATGNTVAGNIVPLPLDVTNRESIDQAIATIRQRIGADGHLHALVNNAGVDFNGPLQSLTHDEIVSMVNVNLLGGILLSRAALSLMQDSGSRLVFVGSAMGLWATPTISVYCSTKYGLEGFADSLRVELGLRGIAVSLIEPGVVQTPMTADLPAMMERVLSRMDSAERAIYEGLMRKIAKMSSAPGAGQPATAVAEAIVHAVDAEKPRSRYRVGGDSKAVGILRHLPDSWRDFLQRKTFGI